MAEQQQASSDISTLSMTELKALAFDQMNLIAQSQRNMEVLQKQMNVLAEKAAVSKQE